MRKSMVESIATTLKDLNKTGFVDDSAMEGIDTLCTGAPSHPGEMLKELIMEPFKLSIKDASCHLGVSRYTLSRIINGGGSVTAEIAVSLELAFGNLSAEHWLNLQHRELPYYLIHRPE